MQSLLAAATGSATFPLLTTIVVLPLIGAVTLLLLPSNRESYFKEVAFLFAAERPGSRPG